MAVVHAARPKRLRRKFRKTDMAGLPGDQWAPVSMVPGNARNRRFDSRDRSILAANHRSGDQSRSAPPSWSGTLGLSGTLLTCPCEIERSDHVDAFSDCLVNIHDGQRGCLRGRHRPGSDDSSTRGLRVRNDPGRRCSELFGQRAGGLVDRSHAAVAISEGSFSLEPFPFRLNRNGALDSLFDAFSLREPVSTSLENALVIPDRIRRGHAELPSRAIVGPAIVTP